MVIFHSYVSSPEGINPVVFPWLSPLAAMVKSPELHLIVEGKLRNPFLRHLKMGAVFSTANSYSWPFLVSCDIYIYMEFSQKLVVSFYGSLVYTGSTWGAT